MAPIYPPVNHRAPRGGLFHRRRGHSMHCTFAFPGRFAVGHTIAFCVPSDRPLAVISIPPGMQCHAFSVVPDELERIKLGEVSSQRSRKWKVAVYQRLVLGSRLPPLSRKLPRPAASLILISSEMEGRECL